MSSPTAAQYPIRQTSDNGAAADVQVVNVSRTQEYVTTGFRNSDVTKQSAMILSNNVDEIMRLIGPHTYSQMSETDAEIAKCLTVLKTYVLSDGIEFTPSVPEHDTRFSQAKEFADFCTRSGNNLDTPLAATAEQLLDCMIFGNKVGEITWELKDSGKDSGKLLPRTIKVKPQKSIAFVVDEFKNVLGFKAAQSNEVTAGGKTKIIPREKFIVFTFRSKDSDPRGTSILRAVYNAWHLKMTMWPEYLRWLTNCAIPGLVGVAAEDSDKQYVLNSDGSVATDGSGNPMVIPATSQLANALALMKNASVIAVPYGSSVTTLNNQVSSEPFKTARDVLNEEIEMAILLQTLATSDSQHNTRAASQTAMTVLDVLVYHIKGLVADAIKRDLLTKVIGYNFSDVDPELIPKVSLGDTERRSWASDGTAAADMFDKGMIKDSQLPQLWRQFGIDPPAEGDTGLNNAQLAKQKAVVPPASDKPTNPAPAKPAVGN